jgi:hypothetical protein
MNNTNLVPLVDADYLVYRVGFAVKDDEPVEYALSTVKQAIHNIWDRFPDAKGGQLYLTGKGNFRDKVATIQVYKGNRDPANKPLYYSEIREYMIAHHGAIVVQGMEAEDACGVEQYAHKDKSTCIVGVDKDLMCIPGFHFNPVKDEMVYVTKVEADTHFWKQVLTGDATDNILGCGVRKPGVYKTGKKKGQSYVKREGVGPEGANELLAPVVGRWTEMEKVVLNEYAKLYGSDARAVMDENAKLIWILRERGVTYNGSSVESQ